MPKADFDSLLKLVCQHLRWAYVHWTIREQLKSPQVKRRKLFATYWEFFAYTADAHLIAFLNRVSILSDKRNDQPSFYAIANRVVADPSLAFGVDPCEIYRRLLELEPIEKRLRAWRDKRASHWDEKEPRDNVSGEQIQAYIEALRTLYDDVRNAHQPGYGQTALFAHERDQTDTILNTLTTHLLPK